MIKNIFLDAGGVILDENKYEEESSRIITQIIQEIKNYSIDDYWNDVEEAVYRFVPTVYNYILYKNIKNPEKYINAKQEFKNRISINDIFKITDGLLEFLEVFSPYYRIGILGQYGIKFKKYLEMNGILKYFTFSEIQDNYLITKPDTRYYEAILNNCNCLAGQSIMIGDRIDKDIIPAKMVGMKTIRIRTGIHKTQEPRVPEENPDITVEKLNEIKIDRIRELR